VIPESATAGFEFSRWQRMLLPGAMVDGPSAGRSLRDWIVDAAVDVVLMDIRMPELDGIAAAGLLARQPPPPAILMLTTFEPLPRRHPAADPAGRRRGERGRAPRRGRRADRPPQPAQARGCAGGRPRPLQRRDLGRAHLSEATVKAHVSKLLEKLEVANRVQIALLVRDAETA